MTNFVGNERSNSGLFHPYDIRGVADSELLAFDYDERDTGVLRMIKWAVEGCQRNQRHSGICGQAPSDYPEVAEYLVKLGIDSISLNPDSVLKTIQNIDALETKLSQ